MDKLFTGSNDHGDFVEALHDALTQAVSHYGPDSKVKWEFKGISGEYGTIAGIDHIHVAIHASKA